MSEESKCGVRNVLRVFFYFILKTYMMVRGRPVLKEPNESEKKERTFRNES